ncbi:MAG: hypothetical protein Q4P72_04985 [Eubacteriales bacterium]|nr:hypothetical protein [Eubacteriales bacterium]
MDLQAFYQNLDYEERKVQLAALTPDSSDELEGRAMELAQNFFERRFQFSDKTGEEEEFSDRYLGFFFELDLAFSWFEAIRSDSKLDLRRAKLAKKSMRFFANELTEGSDLEAEFFYAELANALNRWFSLQDEPEVAADFCRKLTSFWNELLRPWATFTPMRLRQSAALQSALRNDQCEML